MTDIRDSSIMALAVIAAILGLLLTIATEETPYSVDDAAAVEQCSR